MVVSHYTRKVLVCGGRHYGDRAMKQPDKAAADRRDRDRGYALLDKVAA